MQKQLGTDCKKKNMHDMLMCLCAMQVLAFYYYGYRTLIVSALSVITCCTVDYLFVYYRKRSIRSFDISPIVTGLIFSLLMPATIRYDILVVACIIMMIIGKHAFGGVGNPVFQATAVGYAFAYLCWKDELRLFPRAINFGQLDLSSSVTDPLQRSFTYFVDRVSAPADVTGMDLALGRFSGPMGTTHIIVLSVCAICLMSRRSISLLTFFSSLSVILGTAFFFPPEIRTSGISSLTYELLSGSMLFCLVFIGSDLTFTPKKKFARVFYGISLGAMTIVFRRYSNIEVPVVFASIIVNPLAGLFDDCAFGTAKALKLLWAGIKKLPHAALLFIKFIFTVLYRIPSYVKTAFIYIKNKISTMRKLKKLKVKEEAIIKEELELVCETQQNINCEAEEDVLISETVEPSSEEESISKDEPSSEHEEIIIKSEPFTNYVDNYESDGQTELFIASTEITAKNIPTPLKKASKNKTRASKSKKKTTVVLDEQAEETIQYVFDFEKVINEPEKTDQPNDNEITSSENPDEIVFDKSETNELEFKDKTELSKKLPTESSKLKIINIEQMSNDKTLIELEVKNTMRRKTSSKKEKSNDMAKNELVDKSYIPKKSKNKAKDSNK